MARIPERASVNDMLEVLKKQWLDTKDIKILASVSLNKAREIKNKITLELTNGERKCFLPQGLVPNEEVVKYLNINVKYLKKISE